MKRKLNRNAELSITFEYPDGNSNFAMKQKKC